ncbi:hypothetical protein [Parabacteroides goldsteinii]|uniref:hypothetical protein n=1 Tax=Parabacteroides goldsteinii TaxID=328812 RepID=UPI0025B63D9A|nr:hypothetical protein [Parabacteroides goldsteinii]
MKGILVEPFHISENEILKKGLEVEVISKWDDKNYVCEIPGGKRVRIWDMCLKITDYGPYIDWEQRRYELAKSAMQGYCIALGLDDDNSESYKNIAIGSLRAADAIIERLKKNKI